MYSTPRKQARHGGYPQSQVEPVTPRSIKKRPDKGLFSDGQWWCNCEPRKRLNLYETKKEGPNKGKFFYKCFECNLFLWWDQAKLREIGLESPSKGGGTDRDLGVEPPLPKTPALTQTPLSAYGYTSGRHLTDDESDEGEGEGEEMVGGSSRTFAPAVKGMETPSRSTSKRKLQVFEEDDFGDFESDVEREMIEIADKSAEKMRSDPKTFATPSHSQSSYVAHDLPTPSVARTLFPEAKRQKQVSFEPVPPASSPSPATLGRSSPGNTPSSSPMPPTSSPMDDTSYDVTDKVMGLLRDQPIDPGVLHSVRSVLETAARRAKGFAMGRESVKAAMKTREEKIAVLQDRVVALENRERMHQSQVTNIKANLMKMYEEA